MEAKGIIPMTKLDAIDKRLLEILQKDSKTNVKEMANELNLTKTPIYDRIKKFDREGTIEKYVAVLNQNMIEASMVIFCTVSIDSQKLDQIEKFSKAIEDIPEVIEGYLMGGSNDFLLKVIVKDLQA